MELRAVRAAMTAQLLLGALIIYSRHYRLYTVTVDPLTGLVACENFPFISILLQVTYVNMRRRLDKSCH